MRSIHPLKPLTRWCMKAVRPIRSTFSPSSLRRPQRLPTTVAALARNSTTDTSTKTVDPKQECEYFRYTGGRWLWDEQQQLKVRYKAFNVAELQRIAASAVEAQSCVLFAKIGEGSYNKVFRLTMDNGVTVIARIPNPNAGPPKLCTSSEVATMDLVRNILDIPLPKIYAWSSDPENEVGSEYIIMEEAKGSNLGQLWGTMSLSEKVSIARQLVSIERKLLGISFSHYGSIFYANEKIPGCEKVEVVGDIPEHLRQEVEDRFVMGPVVKREYWDDERAEMDIDRGPWDSLKDFIRAPAYREIAWIKRYALPKLPTDPLYTSAAQNSPEAHTSLLNRYLDVCALLLPEDKDLNSAMLWHRDLHAGNLFVLDGQISSLIDWQASSVEPFFLQGRHPHLVQYSGEVLLRLPENVKQLDREQREAVEEQVSNSIILYTYETQTAKDNPLLHRLFHLNHGKTRIETINFSGNTWTDDIIPLRECLIRVERDWKQIRSDVPCPIHFTPEEIQAHREDGEGWNDVQDFWDSVAGIITRDGWTSYETYPEALQFFQELRKLGLKNMMGTEREQFEMQTRWAEECSSK